MLEGQPHHVDVLDEPPGVGIAVESQQLAEHRRDHFRFGHVLSRKWPVIERTHLPVEIPFTG